MSSAIYSKRLPFANGADGNAGPCLDRSELRRY
jgi:hypothetical protein